MDFKQFIERAASNVVSDPNSHKNPKQYYWEMAQLAVFQKRLPKEFLAIAACKLHMTLEDYAEALDNV